MKTEARAIDGYDMHLNVDCPECNANMEITGFVFLNEDEIECVNCKSKFQITKIHNV